MKRTRILQLFTLPVAVALLLGLATPPKLDAEFECKQELLTGAWSYIYPQENLVPNGMPQTGSGIVIFDQEGKATYFGHIEVSKDGAAPLMDVTQFLDVQCTVTSDCRGNCVFRIPSTGEVVQETGYVFADGQRLAWGLTTVPPNIGGIVTMKKLGPADAELEAKVDALGTKIDLIMRWLGLVVPSGPKK